MKTVKIITNSFLILVVTATILPGCQKLLGLKLQENYDYQKKTLDPNINMTAKEFLLSRADGSAASPGDTVFRWMKKGLDYAGIDLAEYEKSGRTFIFLHNDAVRVYNTTTKTVTAGFFYNFPIVDVDATGKPIIDPTTGLPKSHPALSWNEYSQATVKNYLMYLIGQGVFNFYDLNAENKAVQSLLPPGTAATRESMLGYWDGINGFTNSGKGFDQDGKFYLRIQNNADIAPIMFNDRTGDRSGGYVATNGIIHVYSGTVYPLK